MASARKWLEVALVIVAASRLEHMPGEEFEWLDDPDVVSYCLTFIRDVTPSEALNRLGVGRGDLSALSAVDASDLAPPSEVESGPVRADIAGQWALLIEDYTERGADPGVLRAFSGRCRVVPRRCRCTPRRDRGCSPTPPTG